MPLTLPELGLVGRERELDVLAALVDGIPDRGGALVVRGDPGVGKSTLLAAAQARAVEHGVGVLATSGVEAEAHLPFAGLHQLLRPARPELRRLPTRQPGRPPIAIAATPCRHGPPFSHPLAGDVIGSHSAGTARSTASSGSPATPSSTGACARSPSACVGTALLHVGGVRFPVTGPVRYTMTARDAVELCRLVRPRTAIPIHYEGWLHFRQGREAIERALTRAPAEIRESVEWLPPGTGVEIAA